MGFEIQTIERQFVTDCEMVICKLADHWTSPERPHQKARIINKPVYVCRVMERRDRRHRRKRDGEYVLSKTLSLTTVQGFMTPLQLASFKKCGKHFLHTGSSFVALTPKAIERLSNLTTPASVIPACKRPFEWIKSGRAKVYVLGYRSIWTLGGRKVAAVDLFARRRL